MFNCSITLPAGGQIIIHTTEALVAIDVNSGKSRKAADIQTNALQNNIEAAAAIMHQIRLRNISGIIVIDFIDMNDEKLNVIVEQYIKELAKKDKAKIDIDKINQHGLLSLTRQRGGASMLHKAVKVCAACSGTGFISTHKNTTASIIRSIYRLCNIRKSNTIEVVVAPVIFHYLSNYERHLLCTIEKQNNITIVLHSDPYILETMFTTRERDTGNNNHENE